ncbi:MAG: thiamine diphosphokinase [bacterium]
MKGGRRVVILAAGKKERAQFYRSFLRSGDILLCADGGAMEARKIGVVPDAVIGDFDSFEGKIPPSWKATRFLKFPCEKDKTDLELALDEAFDVNPDEILIVGGLGGRLDHSLANILLLSKGLERGVRIRLISEEVEVLLLKRGEARISGKPGELISLIPFSEKVSGIDLEGFRYVMKKGELSFGSTRGISNELAASEGIISIASGLLLVVKFRENGRDQE